MGGSKFFTILFLDPQRRQDGRDGPEHDGVDVVVMQPSLFGECFRDNRPDIFVPHGAHRLIILATFSNPRFAK